MSKKTLLVGHHDFRKLCQLGSPGPREMGPNIEFRKNGVFLKCAFDDDENDPFLTPDEAALMTEHHKGDPYQPCLTFPCSLEEMERFLDYYGLGDLVHPDDMEEWVRTKTEAVGGICSVETLIHIEAMGLLLEVFSQHAEKFKNSNKEPNRSQIVKVMHEHIPEDKNEMGDRKLKATLSRAIVAWEERKSGTVAQQGNENSVRRDLEVFGLLVEAFSKHFPKYQSNENPNLPEIAKEMHCLVLQDVSSVDNSDLEHLLQKALEAWKAKEFR